MFTACSSSDNDEEKAAQNSIKFIEHHVDTYGVQEVNDGTVIRYTCSTCDQFSNPAKNDVKDLVYLTTTTIREPRDGGNTVIVYSKQCFAFYYSTVERDLYYEYKDGNRRQLQKNIKLTIKYIGCTPETPKDLIPTDTETKHISYPDIVGEWMPDINPPSFPSSGDSGNSGSESDSGSGSSGSSKVREYVYQGSTSCYNEDGRSEVLYIYKSSKNGRVRASWVYDSNGLILGATMEIHSGGKSIGGRYYGKYVCPFGICYYFNW